MRIQPSFQMKTACFCKEEKDPETGDEGDPNHHNNIGCTFCGFMSK